MRRRLERSSLVMAQRNQFWSAVESHSCTRVVCVWVYSDPRPLVAARYNHRTCVRLLIIIHQLYWLLRVDLVLPLDWRS
uniref:Uncharacterized protein n=1 Tax=Arundo donax TaxID=35708 RepID=A0A0A9ES58_ARUDO